VPPGKLLLAPDQLEAEDEWTQYLVRLHPHRDRLAELEIAACISGAKDPVEWKLWTDPANREDYERRFKLPFDHEDQTKRSPLGMLVVKNMLLTGFDAPVEQVLYLDRVMADHELLQAITRVNRKKSGKRRGYIVDYAGVADALAAAMKAVRKLEEEPDGDDGSSGGGGGFTSLTQSLPRLVEAHRRVLDVFTTRGVASLLPIDQPVQLLADAAIRADFLNKLRTFLSCLGAIFTRPEAAPYKRDAKILGFIARVAANVYQDAQLLLLGVERKVKELVDTYIAAQGIDPKIPPTSILDAKFADEIKKYSGARTRASAMAHALRLHLNVKLQEDPARYKTMSEKLEAVLQQLKDRWEEQIRAMAEILREMEAGDEAYRVDGIEPEVHGPFFGLLRDVRDAAGMAELDANSTDTKRVVEATQNLVDHIRQEISTVDFWQDPNSRRQLENWIYTALRQSRIIPKDKAEETAVRLVDLAYNRRRYLRT
jgi:type I restriction enzyme, R subunit